jgi:hypothetical protein
MGPYRKFLRPHRRGTSPGEEYGRTPWGKSLGKPNCGFTFRRPPLGLPSYKLFPSGSPTDFFTGVGASSNGCRWNCRKWFPPGRGNMRRRRAGEGCGSQDCTTTGCGPGPRSSCWEPHVFVTVAVVANIWKSNTADLAGQWQNVNPQRSARHWDTPHVCRCVWCSTVCLRWQTTLIRGGVENR